MKFAALSTFVLAAVFQASAQVSDPAQAAAIVNQLEDAPTSAARFNLLKGRDFVFDFNAGVGVAKGAGGNITIANIADFPYLVGKGMTLAVGKMAPCGLSTPHYHPRATEFLYMLSGSNLKVGFIQENGARFISNTLSPGQGTIFPKGSFHYQANLDCDPVSFVAGLNSEDPGVATVAQRFFGIPPDVADVTLGDIGVDEVVRIAQSIPDTFALGVQSCLTKCKISPVDQPKTQQQPRVDGNEFPTGGKPGSNGGGSYPPSKPSDGYGNENNGGGYPPSKPTDSYTSGYPPSKPTDRYGNPSNGGNDPPSDGYGNPTSDPPSKESGNNWGSDEWYNHGHKRDLGNEDPASAFYSLISSTKAQTLEELVFFLKLVLGVLLSGYVFIWAFFVVPTWRNRRLQAELQAPAAVPPPVLVQDVKA